MKAQRLSSDIISTLPQEIIDNILTFMPIRDALRTSILSRKWRYCWASIPKLVLDDKLFTGSSFDKQITKHKLANAIFQVLLLHKGPLVEFSLSFEQAMVPEIDQIILYLSRKNPLKCFKFKDRSAYHYKLPSSFFSLQGLENLEISGCDFELPLTFNGFSSKLLRLKFIDVNITAKMLKSFLTNFPQLKIFYLVGSQNGDFAGGNSLAFVELFECLPSIVRMAISWNYMMYFTAGGIPQKLPTPLTHLRELLLGVCFMAQDELSALFCLIKSSPNLKRIGIALNNQRASMDLVDLQDYSDLKLDHLEKLEMVYFNNLATEVKFVKLVLAKAPLLKEVRIELNANISVHEEVRILRDFLRVTCSRSSPLANFIIERREKSS